MCRACDVAGISCWVQGSSAGALCLDADPALPLAEWQGASTPSPSSHALQMPVLPLAPHCRHTCSSGGAVPADLEAKAEQYLAGGVAAFKAEVCWMDLQPHGSEAEE